MEVFFLIFQMVIARVLSGRLTVRAPSFANGEKIKIIKIHIFILIKVLGTNKKRQFTGNLNIFL